MPTSARPEQGSGRSPQRRRATSSQGRRRSPSATGSTGALGSTGGLGSTASRASLDGTTASLSTSKRKRVRGANVRGNAKRSDGRARRAQGRHAAPHSSSRRRGLPVWAIALVVVLVIGLSVGGFLLVRRLFNPFEGARVEDGQTVTVVIPEGSTGSEIINSLLEAGVIHSSKDFRRALEEQNADQSMKSGTYSFVTGADPEEVVRQLVAGPNSSEGKLQVPEGLTLVQTAALVESSLGIPQDDFLAQAKASNYVDDYAFLADAGSDSLEGFLYPKTYDFAGKDVSADAVIRLMLTQFETEVDSLDMDSARAAISSRYNLTATPYDILKIASIIEKEAINEDDRPKVSSVFYNRLSANMALQSDATMGYETGGAVSAEDLSTDSPYNTYLYKGLPPTPICSPSLWAIEAAMEPADTEYYYFFIIEDGTYSNHTFSETYEEHDSAYTQALAEQAEAASKAGSTSSDAASSDDAASADDGGDE